MNPASDGHRCLTTKGVKKTSLALLWLCSCVVQLVLSHVGLMRISCTTIRKLPKLSFSHTPVDVMTDDALHEELDYRHFFFLKSMYLLESQKCINYSIQRIAKRHLRCDASYERGRQVRTARRELRLPCRVEALTRGSYGRTFFMGKDGFGVSGQILRLGCILLPKMKGINYVLPSAHKPGMHWRRQTTFETKV